MKPSVYEYKLFWQHVPCHTVLLGDQGQYFELHFRAGA